MKIKLCKHYIEGGGCVYYGGHAVDLECKGRRYKSCPFYEVEEVVK